MPISQLNFQGINRAISDYGNAGACEELINLRPTTAGLVPVKPFTVKMAAVTYDRVYVHKAGGRTNYIGVKMVRRSMQAPLLVIDLLTESGAPDANIDRFEVESTIDFDTDLHFACVGNYVLFSICNRGGDYGPENGWYANKCYLWNGAAYSEKEADIPDVSFSIDDGWRAESTLEYIGEIGSSTPEYEFIRTVEDAFSAAQEKNPDICFGYILIALAFKTEDGKTFWTGKWQAYDPAVKIGTGAGPYRDVDDFPNHQYDEFFSKYGHGYQLNIGSSNSNPVDRLTFYGSKPKLVFDQLQGGSWNEGKSIIRSVEVYVSKPVPYIDISTAYEGYKYVGSDDLYHLVAAYTKYEDADLGNQLLYFVKSIPLAKLAEGEQEVELSFGGNIQVTNRTLQVDAGAVTRYGNMLAYNARFHFFDSVARTEIGMPFFLFDGSLTTRSCHVFVTFNDGKSDSEKYLGAADLPEDPEEDIFMVVAGDIRVKRVSVMYEEHVTGMNYDYAHYWWYYDMEESARYNCAFHFGTCDSSDYTDDNNAFLDSPDNIVITDEPEAINVTEQYNPFVFNVKNSYLAPGRILDVQPQMVAVKDVSFGDYPLDVFTNRGVYALLQGNGEVLYGAFRPVSSLVSTANSIPTESGTFFLAAGGLWVVAGSRAVLISDALHLGPHKYIRSCEGFIKISMGNGTGTQIAGTYDTTGLLSSVPFLEYVYKETESNGTVTVSKASLSYNRYRDELYISNPDYDYIYVLSIKYRQWFKIDGKISQGVPGSDIAETGESGGSKNILDLSKEDSTAHVMMHLQSRPFSIGYQYSHVHRIVSMIRANLASTDSLIVALYGSDNLQDWTLLSYAAKASVKVSQIRTPAAARSWRYYTLCIGGTAPSDTDISTVMVEYIPVIRRLG